MDNKRYKEIEGKDRKTLIDMLREHKKTLREHRFSFSGKEGVKTPSELKKNIARISTRLKILAKDEKIKNDVSKG